MKTLNSIGGFTILFVALAAPATVVASFSRGATWVRTIGLRRWQSSLHLRATLRSRLFVREIGWAYAVLFGLLANIPMWIAGGTHTIDVSGWFNLDFLAVGVVALFLPRAISASLLLLAILLDFLAQISRTYFITPAEFLSNIQEIGDMPARLIAQLCAGVFLILAITSGVFFLPKLKRRFATAFLLASFALVCRGGGALEEYFGGLPLQTGALDYERPTRSIRVLISAECHEGDLIEEVENDRKASTPVQGAANAAYHWLSSNSRDARLRPDFVLVLVESWGKSTDQVLRQSLVQPYEANLGGRFTVLEGSVPFHGPTISGENRELCGRSGGQSVMEAPADAFRNCLPDELRDQGFHTIAIHGNHGSFYHRKEWYLRAGFQETWFKWNLESAGLPDCAGLFIGVCDSAIASWIGKRLERPDADPRFIYWVTLNSHLPVPNPPSLPTLAPCNAEPSLAADVELCNWYRLILNVHQSIASLAGRNGPRPVVYVVVGDHAPPFSEPALRDSFDQSAVPYVILLPN
jgi:hypothetical protein